MLISTITIIVLLPFTVSSIPIPSDRSSITSKFDVQSRAAPPDVGLEGATSSAVDASSIVTPKTTLGSLLADQAPKAAPKPSGYQKFKTGLKSSANWVKTGNKNFWTEWAILNEEADLKEIARESARKAEALRAADAEKSAAYWKEYERMTRKGWVQSGPYNQWIKGPRWAELQRFPPGQG